MKGIPKAMILFHKKISTTIPQYLHCWFFSPIQEAIEDSAFPWTSMSLKLLWIVGNSPQHHSCFNFLVHSQWILFNGTPFLSPTPHPALLSAACRIFHSLLQLTASCGGSPRREVRERLLRKRGWLSRCGPSPRNPAQQGQGPRWRGWSEHFSAGSTMQAKLAAPCCSLWIRLENLYKERLFRNHTACCALLLQALPFSICSCILFGM